MRGDPGKLLEPHCFSGFRENAKKPQGIKLGRDGFERVKQMFPAFGGFVSDLRRLCDAQRFLTYLCAAVLLRSWLGSRAPSGACRSTVWEKDTP